MPLCKLADSATYVRVCRRGRVIFASSDRYYRLSDREAKNSRIHTSNFGDATNTWTRCLIRNRRRGYLITCRREFLEPYHRGGNANRAIQSVMDSPTTSQQPARCIERVGEEVSSGVASGRSADGEARDRRCALLHFLTVADLMASPPQSACETPVERDCGKARAGRNGVRDATK